MITPRPVDLNSDVGEGFGRWPLGDDRGLLDVITSANIACGFHAGDPSIMRQVCAVAAERDVVIGAHVSYRDLSGFGRRFIDIEPAALCDEIEYQVAALEGFARLAGTSVRYVKPHGGLYNAIISHTDQAAAVVAAIQRHNGALAVLGLAGSEFLRLAGEAGLPTFKEAFADRAYTRDGELVSRGLPDAVILDPGVIERRCIRMVTQGTLETVDGSILAVSPDSICVHGDTAGAVGIARGVRRSLVAAGVTVGPFV